MRGSITRRRWGCGGSNPATAYLLQRGNGREGSILEGGWKVREWGGCPPRLRVDIPNRSGCTLMPSSAITSRILHHLAHVEPSHPSHLRAPPRHIVHHMAEGKPVQHKPRNRFKEHRPQTLRLRLFTIEQLGVDRRLIANRIQHFISNVPRADEGTSENG